MENEKYLLTKRDKLLQKLLQKQQEQKVKMKKMKDEKQTLKKYFKEQERYSLLVNELRNRARIRREFEQEQRKKLYLNHETYLKKLLKGRVIYRMDGKPKLITKAELLKINKLKGVEKLI